MIKKLRLLIFTSLLCVIFAAQGKTAYFTKDEAGTTSAQFLKLGIGARALAMGEAYTGLADDITSIYWNPAGLNHIEDKEFSAMRALWVSDIALNWLAYAQKGLGGSLGAALIYLTSGNIARYDNAGNALNDAYSDSDTAFIVSYARKVNKLNLGINLKLLDSRLENESATGIAADVGISGRLLKNDKLNFGIVVQNIGDGLKFMQQRAPLPLNIKAGTAFATLKDRLILTSDLNFPIDYAVNAHFGAEYRYSLGAMDFFPRVGYQTTYVGDLNALTGLSVGFGVTYNNMSINYAWVPYGELGDTNWLDFGFKFGRHNQSKIIKGRDLYAKGMYAESIKAFEDVLKIDPQNVESIKYIKLARQKIFEAQIELDDKHFDFNSTRLTKATELAVKENIRLLKSNPDARIRIAGYSSCSGTAEYNQKLSERRAKVVEAMLIKEGGIAPKRITTIGYGETRPAAFEPYCDLIDSKAAHDNMRVLFEIIVK